MNAKGFAVSIDEWVATMNDGIVDQTQEVAREVLKGVVERSPRDTNRFASNHIVSIGLTFDVVSYDVYDDNAISRGNDVIDSLQVAEPMHVFNALPYAGALEDGHSGQAPDGVYAPTLQDVSVKFGR